MDQLSWTIFINNCEMLFRMYQIRQRVLAGENERADSPILSCSSASLLSPASSFESSIFTDTIEGISHHAGSQTSLFSTDTGNHETTQCSQRVKKNRDREETMPASNDKLYRTPSEKLQMKDAPVESCGHSNRAYVPDGLYQETSFTWEVKRLGNARINKAKVRKPNGRIPNFQRKNVVKFSDNSNQLVENGAKENIPDEDTSSDYWRSVNLQYCIDMYVQHSNESRWRRIRHMYLEQQGRVLSYAGSTLRDARSVSFAQGKFPLNPSNYYFTVRLLNPGLENYVAIGLASKSYPCFQMPGWVGTSVGYHADDGRLYLGAKGDRLFGPTLQAGDEVGCGVLFSNTWKYIKSDRSDKMEELGPILAYRQADECDCDTNTYAKIFITVNNKLIGTEYIKLAENSPELYPTIGLLSEGATVEVNLLPTIARPTQQHG